MPAPGFLWTNHYSTRAQHFRHTLRVYRKFDWIRNMSERRGIWREDREFLKEGKMLGHSRDREDLHTCAPQPIVARG